VDDRDLFQIVDAAMAEAARRAGMFLACRPGCTECCIGPFTITALDAERLRAGLARLDPDDPVRAGAIRERARNVVREISPYFPVDAQSGLLDADEGAEERFCRRFEALPCPVLDPASGLCDLYESRPVTCRTFGPPVRFGDEDMPPCRLCFTNAGPPEIEVCRVDVDPGDVEGALLARSGATLQTLVGFALLF
jgi:Fe-S-cluster containining protein